MAPLPRSSTLIIHLFPIFLHQLQSIYSSNFLNYSSFGHGGAECHQTTFDDNNLGNKWQDNIWASSASGNVDFDNNDNKQKKIVHKETERQRRCQMTNLYGSLKSLLPPESTKGRQTTSELIHAAENHIKVEQKNIEELTIQRDNLKKWTNTQNNNLNSSLNGTSSSLPCNYLPVDISVTSYLGGMEILISIDLRMDGFQLSRVLELVLAEGLCVVSYVCTRINGKMLHTIQTEVYNMTLHIESTQKHA
ncbi:hypothetical protein LIER_31165 [Lithospermum erythrorhizon]|uniref:BHLH domain-containing protein n=1 Tax=Lithospermum erythrorhizon TaxID=34254 RepID=A0AAV3RQ16_LITER